MLSQTVLTARAVRDLGVAKSDVIVVIFGWGNESLDCKIEVFKTPIWREEHIATTRVDAPLLQPDGEAIRRAIRTFYGS